MARMSNKRRLEWSFFLNDRTRITYNELCRKCQHQCKQSFRVVVVDCPKYLSKRSARKADREKDWFFAGEAQEAKNPLGTKGALLYRSFRPVSCVLRSCFPDRQLLQSEEVCVRFAPTRWLSRLPTRSALQSASHFEVSTGDPRSLAPLKRLSPVYPPKREIRFASFPFHRVL